MHSYMWMDSSHVWIIVLVCALTCSYAQGGTISTLAGGGSFSSNNGDGGEATSAFLNIPYGVTVDSSGRFFYGNIVCSSGISKY